MDLKYKAMVFLSLRRFPSLSFNWSVSYLGKIGFNGALDGGSRCRMSILRNENVACLCRLFMPMSHVEFKK